MRQNPSTTVTLQIILKDIRPRKTITNIHQIVLNINVVSFFLQFYTVNNRFRNDFWRKM